jgi:membrane-associated phospholipid phosphatase
MWGQLTALATHAVTLVVPGRCQFGSISTYTLRPMQSRPSLLPRIRGPQGVTRIETVAELVSGLLLLGLAAVAGLAFLHRPWANRLDIWGYRLLPADLNSHWAHAFVTLGSMTVLVAGVIVVFLIGILRDWIRAIACATAPVIAVLIVQEIAKPLVDRHNGLTGGLSYPSGTVGAVAALATAFVLVMPPKLRPPVAILGLLAIAGTGAAVVVLRWHYPTDALGGVAVGVGSVLLVDALLHVPSLIARDDLYRRWRQGSSPEAIREPSVTADPTPPARGGGSGGRRVV